MKIAHVCISCFYVDNMGYQENILPKKHFQQGHTVEIITTTTCFNENGNITRREVGKYRNENGIDVVVLPYCSLFGKLSGLLHYVSGLKKELEIFAPDIVFCHGLSFLSIFTVEKYCEKHNVKLYFDNHSDYYNTPTNYGKYRVINGLFWPIIAHTGEKYCVKAWGTTPARCEYLIKTYKFSKEKVDLLVMGGDEDFINFEEAEIIRARICKHNNIQNNDFLLCTGGKINREKKIIELIAAVEKLQSPVRLLIFGSIMPDVETDFFDAISQAQKTRYVGWVNQEEIYNIFLSCDLAVFPGTHSVLWEQAVAAGIPSVFKRRELMQHVDVGGNCLFIDDDSIDGIYEAISKVIDDKKLYNNMVEIAKTDGIEHFSYNSIARKAIGE